VKGGTGVEQRMSLVCDIEISGGGIWGDMTPGATAQGWY
jgi:hypothetical protein